MVLFESILMNKYPFNHWLLKKQSKTILSKILESIMNTLRSLLVFSIIASLSVSGRFPWVILVGQAVTLI